MAESTPDQRGELENLRRRVNTLAQEKAQFQLASELLTSIAGVQGLEETARHAVTTIMDALGGFNVILYYKTEQGWFYCDVNAGPHPVPEILDEQVLACLAEGTYKEYDREESEGLTTFGLTLKEQRVWIYPLKTNQEIYGAIKMDGIYLDYVKDVKTEMGTIIRYLGLALWNEITSSGKLLSAYEALQEESRKLKVEMEERKREEARYRETIESSFDGFWIVDCETHFLEVNAAYCEMIGYSREELLTMSINDIEVNESSEETLGRISELARKGQGQFESRHRHRDGRELDVEVNATYSPEKGGLFYVFIRDLTERHRAEAERSLLEKQLQQAQKIEAIGTLAGGIAHDFNNLLFPLLGYSELLLDDLPAGGDHHEKVSQILMAAERSRDLVKQILAFSRKSDEEKKIVRMQDVLDEAMTLLRSSIPKSIEIREDIDRDVPPVHANSTQIHQVIINLVTNAYHAVRDAGGSIFISLSQVKVPYNYSGNDDVKPGSQLLLKIRDDGCGIGNEDLNRIFDPYFTTKERGEGTGLGLAVVQGIMKSHNGSISVSSRPGEGTEFHLFFPAIGSAGEVISEEDPFLISGTRERILVVDDEDYIVEMERLILERLGYEVVSVVGSEAAYSVFKASKEKFSLLITDMTMPHYNGLQLVDMLREIDPHIPVIICTGYSDKISPENKDDFGIEMVLMKPVARKVLATAVSEVLTKN